MAVKPKSVAAKRAEREAAEKAEEEKKLRRMRRRKWKKPKWPDGGYNLLHDIGKILKRRNELEAAINFLDEAMQLKPPERLLGNILFTKSECKALQGDYVAAIMNIILADLRGASTLGCIDVKARALFEMCQCEEALVNYHKAARNRGKNNKSKARTFYQDGILRCRQVIEDSIGQQAGPILMEMLRWIRIMEDNRQRTLYGVSHGSSPKKDEYLRPVSHTIIASFLASGDISPGRKSRKGGVMLEQKGDIILPDQEEMKVIRKNVSRKMTRHYLGRAANDLYFVEKLAASTHQIDESSVGKMGFWGVQDPAFALYSPVNRPGSHYMISKSRDLVSLLKGLRENLRSREPYHNPLVRAKSYIEREKRMELARAKKTSGIDSGKIADVSRNIPWSKLELARQTAWKHLEATRAALRKDDILKCLSCGERAREVADTLPHQAFSLGRKETKHAGKSAYVRAIARAIGMAYLKKKKVDHSLSEEENRRAMIHMGLEAKSLCTDDITSGSSFPFRDPHRIIIRCEKRLGMIPEEPRASLSEKPDITPVETYEHSTVTPTITGTVGGKLEKAWLFHEMGRSHLQLGHLESAKRWARRAVVASKRALLEENMAIGGGEDEWGGSFEENKKGACIWYINSLLLTARVEIMSGSLENAESALITALDESKKRMPEEEECHKWCRFAGRALRWISQELSNAKSREKRGSILGSNSLNHLQRLEYNHQHSRYLGLLALGHQVWHLILKISRYPETPNETHLKDFFL